MTPPADGVPFNYRFADLTLDVARRCVTRHGQTIELKALDFDLLRFLVESAPNVVNADVLAEKVWGRHFVSPENVAQRVMLLRQSLSDDANRPRYIETVRNKGYRLIPVAEIVPNEGAAARTRRRPLVLIAAALLLAVGVAWWAQRSVRDGPPIIAVLPCESLSSDSRNASLANGFYEDIVTYLVNASLRLAAVAYLRPYAETQKPIAEIAREQNVDFVLECGVRYEEPGVVVTVRLYDVAIDDYRLSDRYERDLSETHAIQREIALAVAGAVKAELRPEERALVERVPTTHSMQALELYHAARVRSNRAQTLEDALAALDELEQALSLDEDFVSARVLYSGMSTVTQAFDPANAAEHAAKGEGAARRALEVDPDSGPAHGALGFALIWKRDWVGGEAEFRVARARNVPFADIPGYAVVHNSVANFEYAREILQDAREVIPQNPVALRFLMLSNAYLDDWTSVAELYARGSELFESWPQGDLFMMHLHVARNEFDQARKLGVSDAINSAMLESLDAPAEARTELHHLYAALVPYDASGRRDIAIWAAHFGDTTLALEAMRSAIEQQGPQVLFVWLPQFKEMRQQLGFKKLLRDTGIVAYWEKYGWPSFCHRLDAHDFECH